MDYVGMGWIILIVVLILVELATLGLTTIWFAGGALAALFVDLCGGNMAIQIVVFIVISVILLMATRPIAIRYLNRDRIRTNVDSLIGQSGVVKEEIDNLQAMGCVLVNGQEWTARSTDDRIITVGKTVVIDSIQGVKLIVRERD